MKVECVNLPAFRATLRAVSEATRKTERQIVNSALKDVCFRAMEFTPFADPAKIEADLRRDKIALKMAATRLAKRAGTVKRNRMGTSKLTARGKEQRYRGPTRAQIAKEAAKIIRRRKAGSRAIRAGWIPAARAVGASVRGGRIRPGSSAARGTGRKATATTAYGFIRNSLMTRTAKGVRVPVGRIRDAVDGLRRAVAYVTSDRQSYLRRKQLQRAMRAAAKQ